MGAAATPPGWYPDVENPGGERYWNGSSWTEDRRPAGGAADSPPPPPGAAPGGASPSGTPPPGYQQPGYQQPGYQQPGYQQPGYQQPGYQVPQGYQAYGAAGTPYPTSSNAGVALALSIAGFVCCGLLAIPGLIMGRNEVRAIDAGQADPSNRGTANAAYIVGIIVLVLNAIGIIGYIIAIAVFAS